MKRLIAFAALFSFISIAMSAPTEKDIDELFTDFSGAKPGAAVMIIQEGKPIFAKAYGMANLERKVPCSTNTNFRLASVTKQFTAMSVLMLAEKKTISLDDKLPKFFPDFPDYGKEVTVRQLLEHTSGIPDYEDYIPTGTKIPLSDRDVLYILRQQDKGYFSPGKEFRYSNSAYALLALLVENVSGETFPAYLKRHIFDPLEMSNSVAFIEGLSSIPNRSFGYAKDNGAWKFSDQSMTSAVLGDGGVYSSILDMFKWDQALYTEKLISKKLLEEAFTIHSSKSDFENSGYGYGWYICKDCDTQRVWHYGSTCGFNTKIERFPEKKLSFIILTNRNNANIDELSRRLVELYLDPGK